MPVLSVYVTDEDYATLTDYSLENLNKIHDNSSVRSAIEELAESAVSEAACSIRRNSNPPTTLPLPLEPPPGT